MPKDNMPLKLNDTERSILKTERCWKDAHGSAEVKYDFNWSISHESHNSDEEDPGGDQSLEFGHQETRLGDLTKGSYFLQLPGNRLVTVEYFVRGDSGFVARVEIVSNESGESGEEEEEEEEEE
ncbi:uncharacterized protein LOC135194855 isoform X3 [Macrobrachium nipponense]|uniref:uncharacterized protein LOC135194855 isoform X3 n=1 Tax=Macrobrachium nipponense TaxID=159736 RepID=UPI0030C7D027